MFWPWTAAQRQDWFAFRDRNKRWYSFTGAFMTVNATAQQRKSLLDKNKRQLTKVTSSLSLSLYRLTTGANVSSLPSMCREFISQNQQLVQPCSLGTSKLYSWLPDFQGQCSGACGGEAPLKIQMPLRHSSSRRPLMLTERTDRQSKDADHAVQAKIPVSFTQKYHPNWS